MIKVRFFSVIIVGLTGIMLTSFLQKKYPIKYMDVATIESKAADKPFIIVTYDDMITNETIFLRKTKDNIPLEYFKELTEEVCDDNECRLLKINVYWNITGRYLGFELPNGALLSKYNHEAFSKNEYQQLHILLADESLPFDKVSFEKLLEHPKKTQEDVDALTGETSKNIADIVVKGAAFTTYKLWNTVNGPTVDVVSELTEKLLTPDLLHRILKSPNITDKLWALNRLDSVNELTPQLEARLLELMASENYNLSYNVITSINSIHLKSAEFQNRMFSIYQKTSHSIKTVLIKKLMEAPFLSSEIIQTSRGLLHHLNEQQLNNLLQLYTKHNINDIETCTVVAEILENENKYISKNAYVFLIGLQIKNDDIIELLNTYKKEKL